MIYGLTLKSLWNRKTTVLLTLMSIALSVALLLGVDHIRREAKSSFTNTISGTDLIVGARSGSVQLLLYSVFRIGNATNNIAWTSYQDIAKSPQVAWTIPISLGDSHRGYRVMGTNQNYFQHFRYGKKQPLKLSTGVPFSDVYEAVLGSEVAAKLGYQLGEDIVIAHGGGQVSFASHDDKPFKVVGILEPTGTPVDRTVHVSLEGIEAIHIGWQAGRSTISAEDALGYDLQPEVITAAFVGLKSKIGVFALQREVNQYRKEPMLAILPGVALQELWALLGVAESALLGISAFVVVTGLLGMLTVIWAGLNERRREMAILRSVGARPRHILMLLMTEAGLMVFFGAGLGLLLLLSLLLLAQPLILSMTGVQIGINFLNHENLYILGAVIATGFTVGLVPALKAYRMSVADGMTVRI
ncbi:ABC transporter permease [Hahella ganghwensis]|uniref:ABC transporter permease n=1 Tax=Hahella ganghwensis TaxID=286420 RepID=UPI00035D92BB|nr:ABC transporter permease [Hahella ganghwensis]